MPVISTAAQTYHPSSRKGKDAGPVSSPGPRAPAPWYAKLAIAVAVLVVLGIVIFAVVRLGAAKAPGAGAQGTKAPAAETLVARFVGAARPRGL